MSCNSQHTSKTIHQTPLINSSSHNKGNPKNQSKPNKKKKQITWPEKWRIKGSREQEFRIARSVNSLMKGSDSREGEEDDEVEEHEDEEQVK